MELRGEELIIIQYDGTVLKRELYNKGTNLVPGELYNDDQAEFGIVDAFNYMHIDRERYLTIAYHMRKDIENSFSYRIFLKRKTDELLENFRKDTDEFERLMNSDELNADWLEKYLNNTCRMLSLLEYNGMIPYHWFETKFEEVSENGELSVSDFTYAKGYSHRVFLYQEKLKLLRELYDSEDFSQEPLLDKFMEECNYLSDKGDPLTWDFSEKRQELCDELVQMRELMSIEDIEREIAFINKKKTDNKYEYYDNLRRLNEACIKAGWDSAKTSNLIHAVTIISKTCNEEEVRHAYQDRQWHLLNKLVRRLELPVHFVDIKALVEAVRQDF